MVMFKNGRLQGALIALAELTHPNIASLVHPLYDKS
jgi:hypothetical protein